MKKLFLGLLLLPFFGPCKSAMAEIIYNADLVNDTAIALDTNYDLDLREIDTISFVGTTSSTTLAAKTFTDGVKSTGSIMVNDYTKLTPAEASVSITISSSPAGMNGIVVTLNGVRFKEGSNGAWVRNASTTTTATNLAAAINAHADFIAVADGNVVIASAAVVGIYANTWVATATFNNGSTVASYVSFSANAFSGGRQNSSFTIGSYKFTQGVNYTAATSSMSTASSICANILTSAVTFYVTCSTSASAGGLVSLTAANVGTDVNAFTLYSSTEPALDADGFRGGTVSKVDLTNDLISINGHGYNSGVAVLYSTAATGAIGGLTTGTTYYVIKINTGQIKLATSKANATAGTAINLTSVVGGNTYTLTPSPMAATTGFGVKWQASNDLSTFVDLAVSSVTINSTSGSTVTNWNLGDIGYRYLRLKYLAPLFGGSSLQFSGTGRRD